MNVINEIQRFIFEMEDESNKQIVKGDIIGQSMVEGFDDLKLNAVLALLNSIDQQNFQKAGKANMFHDYIKEIEDTLGEIKISDQFQGKVIK